MVRTSLWIVTFALMSGVGLGLPAANQAQEQLQVLSHRAWQLQDYDWSSLERTILKAEREGMNHIQLSHNIIMDVQEIWEGEGHSARHDFLRKAVDLAHAHGLQVEAWSHELSGIPRRLMKAGQCQISTELWDWVEAKYRKFFKLLPEVDGLVLSLSETQCPLIGTNRSKTNLNQADRLAALDELLERLLKVCRENKKNLILRTFSYEPQELSELQAAVQLIMRNFKQEEVPLIIMSKIVPHDWSPYYPYNPALGQVAGLPQIVEFDLGQEFTGQNRVPYAQIGYLKRALDYARKLGVVGAVARVERYDASALDTPNEVNLYAFGRLLQQPKLGEEELWLDWANANFGKSAAPFIIEALRPTYEIVNLTYFPLGQWITDHSAMPSWNYAFSHITSRQTFKWIKSPAEESRRDELLSPASETMIKIAEEKHLAQRLLQAARGSLAQAEQFLSQEAAVRLRFYFETLQEEVERFKHHNLAFFGILALRRECRSPAASRSRLISTRNDAAQHIAKLGLAAPELKSIVKELQEQLRRVETEACRFDFDKEARS